MLLPDGPSNVLAERVVIRTTNLEMGDACSNTKVKAVPIKCNHILESEVPDDVEEILKQIQIPDLYSLNEVYGTIPSNLLTSTERLNHMKIIT
ncbi:hypothetical protein C0J50_17481 [Silurus asotus]|uniref:Uncharacterized protein n=1 Tax=Silurus asotus TaxID=30991 RepID=A0AAD5AWL8_SILAS|nr:hypothetical protein C0J50_17481 [Silurus asotus]